MIAQGGGSIVSTASTAGISGGAGRNLYCIEACSGWADQKYSLDVCDQGYSLQHHLPGGTKTNIGSMTPDRIDMAGAMRAQAFAGLIPAILEPTDIANLALFLASDESRYINERLSQLMPVGRRIIYLVGKILYKQSKFQTPCSFCRV